jgi:transposase
MWRPFTNSIEP